MSYSCVVFPDNEVNDGGVDHRVAVRTLVDEHGGHIVVRAIGRVKRYELDAAVSKPATEPAFTVGAVVRRVCDAGIGVVDLWVFGLLMK